MTQIMYYIEKVLKFLVITAISLLLGIVFLQVISRYMFHYTPSFTEELSRFLFVWVVFLSLPLVAKSGGHMAIETITSRIKGAKLKCCRVAADICTITFLLIMTVNGVRMMSIANFQTSAAMDIPMSWVYAVIPFGCAIMCLNVIAHLIELFRTAPENVE